jgi:hypothetical protein
VSGLLAARVAARLRKDLAREVDLEHGDYAEFTVLVGGDVVIEGGPMTAFGVLPPYERVLAAVRERLTKAN